jgi:endogenous inhibitor of DNA gyrase (YacG/DUF329 family)
MVDLGRWLDGTYNISDPARPDDLSAGDDQEALEEES